MTDLDKLIAAVEAGDFRFSSYLPSGKERVWPHFYKAMEGSLDAAKDLHEALLPKNAYWWVESRPDGGNESGVFIGDLGKTFLCKSTTPARAWLIAILEAYREVTK